MIVIIQQLIAIAIAIFDAGIIVRIIKILMDGQTDESQNTKQMIVNHIKAAIVINILPVLAFAIARYFQ